MAKVSLSDGFFLIPEGAYVFKVTGVSYKGAFGKLEIIMQTQSEAKCTERLSLLEADGSPNEGVLNTLNYFARTTLQDFELVEVNHEDLVSHFIKRDVEHGAQPSKNKPDKTVTFARLADKQSSDGWDEQAASLPTQAPKVAPASVQAASAAPKSKSDLMVLLG